MDAPTIDQLADELRDALLQVHQAEERKDERDVVQAAHEAIARLSERYRVLMQSLAGAEQMRADRLLGRRMMDLKRLGSLLPKMAIVGVSVESTPDRAAGGGAIGQRRITGVSWSQHDRAAPTGGAKVGADIEAYCGKCGETTTHSIVAMVGTEPKQVLCQVCGSRHAYRTGPARPRAAKGDGAVVEDNRGRVAVDPEAQKRAAQMRALGEEVASAADVRRFDPKERYKAGEIISHPVYGRGKIENVLRSSLLVRFSVGGLKSLMLT